MEKRHRGRKKGYISEKRLYSEPTKSAKIPQSWNVQAIATLLVELYGLIERWDQRITPERRTLPRWQHTGELLDELRDLIQKDLGQEDKPPLDV